MEEKPATYIALLEAYQEELENVDRQTLYVQALINDYTRAKTTMENLSKVKEGTMILVPIGGGVLVPVKVEDTSKVLLSEGADVFVERTIDYAVDAVQRKIDELNEGLSRLNSAAQQIRQKIEEISEKLQREKGDV